MQITILRKRGKSTEKVSMTVEKDWTVDKLKRTWAHTCSSSLSPPRGRIWRRSSARCKLGDAH